MDWFQRYGIPGAYSMGLTLVWLSILYPGRIDLGNENTFKIVGGIFAGGFLPFGYLMCMVGNAYYFFRCCFSQRYGRHARARFIADANRNRNEPIDINRWDNWVIKGIPDTQNPIIRCLLRCLLRWRMHWKEIMLGPCSVLAAVSNGNKWDLEKDKYIQEWIRKRTDVVVMNQAIMAGTIVCTIGAFYLQMLPNWSMQPYEDQYWKWFLAAVVFLYLIIWYVTIIARIKIDIVIAGVFNLRRRQAIDISQIERELLQIKRDMSQMKRDLW